MHDFLYFYLFFEVLGLTNSIKHLKPHMVFFFDLQAEADHVQMVGQFHAIDIIGVRLICDEALGWENHCSIIIILI